MVRIKFYADATEVGMPFINIGEKSSQNMIMLLDSGSNENILFGEAYQQMKHLFSELEGDYSVTGIEGVPTKVIKVEGTLPLCGKEHEITFLIRKECSVVQDLSEQMGFHIAGIIGTTFMAEHDWLIDFGKQEVVIPDNDISVNDLRRCAKS